MDLFLMFAVLIIVYALINLLTISAMKKNVFILIVFAISLISCKPEIEKPTVITESVEEITENVVKVTGYVSDDGGSDVTERGICWNTEGDPEIIDNRTVEGSGLGAYTSEIRDLDPNTNYYVRAYATNEAGTAYGEVRAVKTEFEKLNGYEYVDLGLSSGLKWATCNVGASAPEECGDYFAWGETEAKTNYSKENSLTYAVSDLLEQGFIEKNGLLAPSYDAATANWGEGWRMPTRTEYLELIKECTWEWVTLDDVNGYIVTGVNGNHIFLPASGYRYGSFLYEIGEFGYYWNSSKNSDYNTSYRIIFDRESQDVFHFFRCIGLTVRPVTE